MLNSQKLQELLDGIVSNSDYLSITNSIDKLISEFNLDGEQVYEEVTSMIRTQNIQDKYSPVAYINKLVERLILANPSRFRRKQKTIVVIDLFKALEEINMTGENWEKNLICLVEQHIANEAPIQDIIDVLRDTNHSIVDYCDKNNYREYKYFLGFLLKSKVGKKVNIPYKELEEKAKELCNEWDNMLQELDNAASVKYTDDVIEALKYDNA